MCEDLPKAECISSCMTWEWWDKEYKPALQKEENRKASLRDVYPCANVHTTMAGPVAWL